MDHNMRIEFKDMARVVGETWRTLTPKERAPYETLARQETVCYEKEKRVHEEKHRHYTSLYHRAAAAGSPPACQAAFVCMLSWCRQPTNACRHGIVLQPIIQVRPVMAVKRAPLGAQNK